MEFEELLNGFAAQYGIEGLEAKDGAAVLKIDDMNAMLVRDEAADAVAVCVEIGLPPPDANGPFGAMMLKANFLFRNTDGATLCQNPENGAYAIQQTFGLAGTDVNALAAAMERLVNAAERWRGILNGFQTAESAAGDAEREDAKLLDKSAGLFMQV